MRLKDQSCDNHLGALRQNSGRQPTPDAGSRPHSLARELEKLLQLARVTELTLRLIQQVNEKRALPDDSPVLPVPLEQPNSRHDSSTKYNPNHCRLPYPKFRLIKKLCKAMIWFHVFFWNPHPKALLETVEMTALVIYWGDGHLCEHFKCEK